LGLGLVSLPPFLERAGLWDDPGVRLGHKDAAR